MKKFRIYIDTSVIGGCLDEEFSKHSNMLFDCFRKNVYIPVISDTTTSELVNAPEKVKVILLSLNNIEKIEATEEMKELAALYLKEKIVSKKYYDDALHIAIATVINVNVLVSWNFKHIVNLQKIHMFNAVNMKEGYSILEIRTPLEVIDNG